MRARSTALLRGSGFSGVPEILAAAAVLVATLVSAPQMTTTTLGAAVLICLLSGATGRWPVVGNCLVTLALGVCIVLELEIGTAYLGPLIAVEALATTGRRQWLLPAAAVQFVLSIAAEAERVVADVATFWLSTLLTLAFFGAAVALGLVRFKLSAQKQELEAIRHTDLTALRRDIARDLHDSVAHDLTNVVLLAGQARSLSEVPDHVGRQLDAIMAIGQRSIQDMRTMLGVLRHERTEHEPVPGIWDVEEPERELGRAVTRLEAAGFVADSAVIGELGELPPLVGEVLSKCLVEVVNNVVTHGDPAFPCVLRMERGEEVVELAVINTVRPDRSSHPSPLGLVGMAERVAAVRGRLEVGPRRHDLWTVELTIPLDRV